MKDGLVSDNDDTNGSPREIFNIDNGRGSNTMESDSGREGADSDSSHRTSVDVGRIRKARRVLYRSPSSASASSSENGGDQDNESSLSNGEDRATRCVITQSKFVYPGWRLRRDGDEIGRLAESIGSLLYEVVKNIQNSFTSKLEVVLDSVFSRLIEVTLSRLPVEHPFSDISASVLFQCLRNHTLEFSSSSCRSVENRLNEYLALQCDIICQELMNDKKDFESSKITPVATDSHFSSLIPLNPFICALRLIQEWVSIRPRPRGRPISMIRQTASVLSKLIQSLLFRLANFRKHGGKSMSTTITSIWSLAIHTLIKMILSDPEVMKDEVFSHPSSSILSDLHDFIREALDVSHSYAYDVSTNDICVMAHRLLHFVRILVDHNNLDLYFTHEISRFVSSCLLLISTIDNSKNAVVDMDYTQLASISFLTAFIDGRGLNEFSTESKQQWENLIQLQLSKVFDVISEDATLIDRNRKYSQELQTPSVSIVESPWNKTSVEVAKVFCIIHFIKTIIKSQQQHSSHFFVVDSLRFWTILTKYVFDSHMLSFALFPFIVIR